MGEYPAATTFGLRFGLAQGLHVPLSAITMVGTSPGRWPPQGDSTLTVHFYVTGDTEVAAKVQEFAAGHAGRVSYVIGMVRLALAAQSLSGPSGQALEISSLNSTSFG